MDRSQSTLLAVLSALVIAVAALLFFGGAPAGDADPEATAEIWNLDPQDAVSIRIEREAGSIHLERIGALWMIRAPVEEAADPDQVDDLLDVLHNVRNGIPVEVPPGREGDFGLGAPPNARVSFTTTAGTTVQIDVGTEAPTGYRTYVRGADGQISAVNGDLNRPLQADTDQYRDSTVVRFSSERVERIGLPGVALRRVDGRWWIDGLGPADPSVVSDLLDGLHELRFDAFGGVVDGGQPWELGFADGDRLTLTVGAAGEAGWAARAPDGRTGWIAREWLDGLPQQADALAAGSAFGIALESTERVEISRAGHAVEARRNGGAWQATGADDGATWSWVASLARARPAARAPPEWGAADLALTVVNEGRTVTYEIGAPAADGTRAVRDLGVGAVFAIDSGPVDEALAGLPR